ncbi:shewenella-like protein phosphatase 1 [Trifolium medium]|uniref:Shewenella-like protein phosphatase 1 n=1 Tax=Trifolium medium TaxID=97028 RepID=A0A392S6U3_9FABA|nr:shewenella-like protein phosphatase 1 [Trifolium medium]
MASLCMNSLVPLSPSSHSRNLTQTSLSSSTSSILDNNNNSLRTTSTLKPIVVVGDPPTFVSAPGRTILAGLSLFSSDNFVLFVSFVK